MTGKGEAATAGAFGVIPRDPIFYEIALPG